MMLWYDWCEAASDGSFSVPIRHSRDSGACGNQSVKTWRFIRTGFYLVSSTWRCGTRRSIGIGGGQLETRTGLCLRSGSDRVGAELPLYGPVVACVVALDPSPVLLRLANKRISDALVSVSLLQASAEQLPLADAAFDTVVMTWTLCSIPDPVAALSEMRRVLKPGGQLLFVEHGLSPEPGVARWQRWLTPCWSHIGGGCHLNRKTDDLIGAAGFSLDTLDTGYIKGPKPWSFMYQGRATRGWGPGRSPR